MPSDHADDQILNSMYARGIGYGTEQLLAQISHRGRGHQRSRDFPQRDLIARMGQFVRAPSVLPGVLDHRLTNPEILLWQLRGM